MDAHIKQYRKKHLSFWRRGIEVYFGLILYLCICKSFNLTAIKFKGISMLKLNKREKIIKRLRLISFLHDNSANPITRLLYSGISSTLLNEYNKLLTFDEQYDRPIPCGTNVDIDSLMEGSIFANYRFANKSQLRRLVIGFQIPPFFTLSNRQLVKGETCLLIFLLKAAHEPSFAQMQLNTFKNLDHVAIGRAFNTFASWMYTKWQYLLNDHWNFWVPRLPYCAEVIFTKLCTKFGMTHWSLADWSIACFIDNNIQQICRTGGGPVDDGEDSRRWDFMIQNATFTGWLRIHGVKFQTVDAPNGMAVHISGLWSARRNDLYTLQHSNINALFGDAQHLLPIQYMMYGDSIYP